jgi:hypothetical protein
VTRRLNDIVAVAIVITGGAAFLAALLWCLVELRV